NSGVVNLSGLDLTNGTLVLTTDTGGNATVVNTQAIDFGTSNIGGDLSATATLGGITQTGGAWTVAGTSTFITRDSGSNIILDNIGNAFGDAVTLKADLTGNEEFGNITFVDSGGVNLDGNVDAVNDLYIDALVDGTVGGNLSVTATTGAITQGIALTVTGTGSFETVTADQVITLGSANVISGEVDFTTAGTAGNVVFDNGITA
ncbi:MAG: hypothetical protein GY841_11255, partial [FCB group bacterium]|nr:hypothetical protein [FCB group bacterium]